MKPFLKYGLIVAATGILLSLITYLLGLDKTDAGQYIGWINVPIMIVAMVFAIKEKRDKELGGYIEFGKAFSTATLVVLISTAITAIYTYIYVTVINPSFIEYTLQKEITKMEESGKSQSEIDMALPYIEKFMTPTMMSVFMFFGGLVMGIIVALIVAAIMKKPNPNPFDTTSASGS